MRRTTTRAPHPGPYLTDLVGLHVIVNFATDQTGTTASVSYGPFDGTTCTLPSSQSATRSTVTVGSLTHYQWKASLTLPSAGQYCYRVLLGGTDLLGTGNSPVFTTQASAGSTQPFSFAVFGDWGLVDANGTTPDQQNLLGTLAGSGVRFAVTTGDNGYPSGSQMNYGDLQQIGRDTSAIFGARLLDRPGGIRCRSSRRPATMASAAPRTPTSRTGLRTTPSRPPAAATRTTSTAASTARRPRTTPATGTRSTPGPPASTCSTSAWGDTNGGTASAYANDYAAHFAPGHAGVPLAPQRPPDTPVRPQVRGLALPVLLRQHEPGLRHIPAGRQQPRGAARASTA